jgi:hypothetical protein
VATMNSFRRALQVARELGRWWFRTFWHKYAPARFKVGPVLEFCRRKVTERRPLSENLPLHDCDVEVGEPATA